MYNKFNEKGGVILVPEVLKLQPSETILIKETTVCRIEKLLLLVQYATAAALRSRTATVTKCQ